MVHPFSKGRSEDIPSLDQQLRYQLSVVQDTLNLCADDWIGIHHSR